MVAVLLILVRHAAAVAGIALGILSFAAVAGMLRSKRTSEIPEPQNDNIFLLFQYNMIILQCQG